MPRPELDKLNGSNLSSKVSRIIGTDIISGRYLKAQGFPTEGDLCKEFDVSRSVLREAIKILSAKGLLISRPGRGTRVSPQDNWNVLDSDVLEWFQQVQPSIQLLLEFTQMRMAIEPAAAALQAQTRKPESLAAISHAVERMRLAEEGKDDPLDADIAFHAAILEGSGNTLFMQLSPLSKVALKFSIVLTNKLKDVDVADVDAHENLYTAIREGEVNTARELTQNMITEVLGFIGLVMEEERAYAK